VFSELKRQRPPSLAEKAVLRREGFAVRTDRTIACESAAIRSVLADVEQVAPTTATVLLLGETGVGKEVFAQALHNLSPRYRRPMISVSCAAIPKELIESELFGREPGAFTGAVSRQIGRFEAANGSTIFLDEIGDLPLEIQVKLLRVLQERTVERLGGNQSMKVDVRVIAATNRNLEQAVAENTFREDLFYRLNVFPITVPPLRERLEDIPSLVWTFIEEFSRTFGRKIDSISKESLAALQRYPWPGNVRELRNVIEREMIVATGPTLTVAPPTSPVTIPRRAESSKLEDVQAEHITSVLESCRWRVRGTGGAADRLGVKPTTLEGRMARLGISRQKRSVMSGCAGWRWLDGGRLAEAQRYSECRATLGIVAGIDAAAVRVNDRARDRQTYSEAVRFCRHERCEHRAVDLRRQAGPRIPHRDCDTFRLDFTSDRDSPSGRRRVGHRIHGVD
jgi:formate hydrogenlyase transcriptional activator